MKNPSLIYDSTETANIANRALLANIGHEIRSPLAAIVGSADILLQRNVKSDEKSRAAAAIKRNSEYLISIANELLDLAKLGAGNVEVEMQSFNLHDVLEYVKSILNYNARDKKILLNFSIDRSVPKFVKTDPVRLRQILLNVAGNAVKFTHAGSVTVLVRLNHSFLEFDIQDTGVGISKEQQAGLFVSTKLGCGLALSKQLARALGGDVQLMNSSPLKGSCFKIALAVDTTAHTSIELPAKLKNNYSIKGLKILLVDDSPDNQFVIQKMLQPYEAQVSLANDGSEGLYKAMTEKYDCILLDIQMPRIDGYAAIRKLRTEGFSKPVIALTACARKADHEQALQSGFDAFLAKPVSQLELFRTIAELSDQKWPEALRARPEFPFECEIPSV